MELIALLLEKFLRLFRSSFLWQNYVLAEASLVHGYLFLSEGPLLIWICLLSLHLLYFSWVIFYYKKWNFSLVLILLILIGFPCFRKDPYSARPFEGLNIVDVGCGGGILSEVFIYFVCLSLTSTASRKKNTLFMGDFEFFRDDIEHSCIPLFLIFFAWWVSAITKRKSTF